jgi:hypothetical protein
LQQIAKKSTSTGSAVTMPKAPKGPRNSYCVVFGLSSSELAEADTGLGSSFEGAVFLLEAIILVSVSFVRIKEMKKRKKKKLN